jgi:hypothetical protein
MAETLASEWAWREGGNVFVKRLVEPDFQVEIRIAKVEGGGTR